MARYRRDLPWVWGQAVSDGFSASEIIEAALVKPLECERPETVRAAFFIAKDIVSDPQAHIDALCEAGVLERTNGMWAEAEGVYFRVVQPHKHEWRVRWQTSNWVTLDLLCMCGEIHSVPNRWPGEVPK